MVKYTLIALTAATLLSSPAMASSTIMAEYRLADVREGAPDSSEFKVEFYAPLNSVVKYGAELQVKQKDNQGNITSKVSAKAGPNLPDLLGFSTFAYGEVGKNMAQGDNFEFWGAGVKTSRTLVGPVSVSIGYRHREGFNTVDMVENRINAGLGLAINDSNSLGIQYYRTTGSTRSDALGFGITHKF